MDIRLDRREQELLAEILHERYRELLHEISHTDDRKFKAMLKNREQVLEALLAKLGAKEEVSV
jgi:hypothetical protein